MRQFSFSSEATQIRDSDHPADADPAGGRARRLPPTPPGMSLLAEIQALIQSEAARQAFLQRMQAAVRPEDFERIVALEQLLVRAHETL